MRIGQVKDVAHQIFTALKHCHELGVMHRDVKGRATSWSPATGRVLSRASR